MKIVLTGQTPSQKNGKSVGVTKSGRVFVASNKIVKAWQDDVAKQLLQYRGQTDGKVTITYKFYCKDQRRRDIDNMVASVNDALVKAGLLPDDSWQCLSIGAAEGEYDKENPRCELWVDEA